MTNQDPSEIIPAERQSERPGFFSRLLRTLLRLLLTILVGLALGGALYFGARSFYRQAVLIPAQESLTRMENLSGDQARFATQSAAEVESLHERISQLEKNRQSDAEELSSLQVEIGLLQDQMEASQSELLRLDSLEHSVSVVATQSMKNGLGLDSLLSSAGGPVNELRHEIQLLRAMELLNRCRLYLSQNNYGLAAQDAALVRQIFLEMKAEGQAEDQAVIDNWIERLDLALTNLSAAPVLAGEDLEMVWRMVLLGLPPQGATLAPPGTPLPTQTPWFTLTPAAGGTITPTTGMVTPTPTPK